MEENKNIEHKKPNVEFEKIEISVTSDGQEVSFSHTTEVDHTCIIGVALVVSNENALPNSTLELDVDGQKVFPTGFEAKLIYSGQEVPPDDRFFKYINRPVKQVKIEGKYTDGSALSTFASYTANLYLMMLTNRKY